MKGPAALDCGHIFADDEIGREFARALAARAKTGIERV